MGEDPDGYGKYKWPDRHRRNFTRRGEGLQEEDQRTPVLSCYPSEKKDPED